MYERIVQNALRTELVLLKKQASQGALRSDSSMHFRRIAVLFALAVLGLGVWDQVFLVQNPMRMQIVVVGGVIAFLLLVLMTVHDRRDERNAESNDLLLEDYKRKKHERIHLGGIRQGYRVTDASGGEASLLTDGTDWIFLAGERYQEGVDEYYHRRLEAGMETPMTFACDVLIERWPVSGLMRVVELVGPQLDVLSGNVPFASLKLPVGTEFFHWTAEEFRRLGKLPVREISQD